MKNNENNRKKPIEGKDYRVDKSGPSNDSSKLRNFLNNLDKDTCEEDYTETPIYKMGWEDGEAAGYEIASQKFQNELRSLRTMIDAMIDSK